MVVEGFVILQMWWYQTRIPMPLPLVMLVQSPPPFDNGGGNVPVTR